MNPPHPAAENRQLCRCGHEQDLHEHYRPGSDCGVGGPAHCAAFRHAAPLTARVMSRLRRAGTAAPAPVADLAPVYQLAAFTHRAR